MESLDLESNPVTVAQVDLVPTLSLLLGTPIPFANLGFVIPELFSHMPRRSLNIASGLLFAPIRGHIPFRLSLI
jgi:hypothetical protein